ncbi:MAG: hypothetical protein U0228_23600 [Myxococcaceae bacterium]
MSPRWVVAVMALCSSVATAEDIPAPLALKVMLKVLSYDPAVAQHGGELVVAIPWGEGGEPAATALLREATALDIKTINERPLRFVAVPLSALKTSNAGAVVLSRALGDEPRREAIRWCRDAHAYSLSMTEQGVLDGALVGVGVANDKPQPLINVTTARALGADFKTVLRLARIVQ